MTPELPAGARCYIDANILVYFFVRDPLYSMPCSDLMKRIQSAELQACTSALMISEALHRIMLSDVQARFGQPKPLAYVQRHPEIIGQLATYHAAATGMQQLMLELLPVESSLFSSVSAVASQYRLLTGDATTVALMLRHGVPFLATNDDDFDAVSGITCCKPR